MTKSTCLLLLCIYLTLQHNAAQPLEKDTSGKELPQTQINKTHEASFVEALEPVIVATLDGVEGYFNTLLAASAQFFADVLKQLKALPEPDAYTRELTLRLSQVLERLNATPLSDRNALIRDIGDIYADFDNIVHSQGDDSKAGALKQVALLLQFQLLELNWRVNSSVNGAVRKFRSAFEQFWQTLSEAQRSEQQRLGVWYEHFKAGETSQDKLKGLEEFLQLALELAPIKQK